MLNTLGILIHRRMLNGMSRGAIFLIESFQTPVRSDVSLFNNRGTGEVQKPNRSELSNAGKGAVVYPVSLFQVFDQEVSDIKI